LFIGLLEDDLAIQEMLRLVLECVGHEVAVYETAEACLAALHITEQAPGLSAPDLLIADQRLPKSASGTAVIELMRANPRLKTLPIILMTASAFPDKRALARLHVTLLAKPFDIDDVVRLVDKLTSSAYQKE
jgi:CheY-like chemotaxis protein